MKRLAELGVQTIGVVSHDIESATLTRPIRAERCDDDMAIGFNRVGDALHVSATVVLFGQEMKDSPVVPDIVMIAGS